MQSYYWQTHTPDHIMNSLETSKPKRSMSVFAKNENDNDFWGAYIGIFICFIFFLFFLFVLWYPMSYYYDNDWNNNGIHDARERSYVHRHGVW